MPDFEALDALETWTHCSNLGCQARRLTSSLTYRGERWTCKPCRDGEPFEPKRVGLRPRDEGLRTSQTP